ncbi:iron(III) ABC transporter, permease domain protein, partial [Vibrio cholerae HC-55A1]
MTMHEPSQALKLTLHQPVKTDPVFYWLGAG